MSEDQELDAVMVEDIAWVKPIDASHVAFHLTDGENSEVFVLDGVQAAKLAGGLLAHMPAPAGTELRFELPDGLKGEQRVIGTEVTVDYEPEAPLFSLTLRIGGDKDFTMTMSHQELLRWIGQMQAKAAEHARKRGN